MSRRAQAGAAGRPCGETLAEPRFAVCVTTMNRVEVLAACLARLAECDPPPACIVVSDDSADPAMRAANEAVVRGAGNCVYLAGPRRGVCANRNNAVRHCLEHCAGCTHVSFIDDDILVERDFFAAAGRRLAQIAPERRAKTMLTGGASSGPNLHECRSLRLSFACYFEEGDEPQCVNLHASVFPLGLFSGSGWDENIFFGTEDAELALRALHQGYTIELEPALRSRDTMPGDGVLKGDERRAGLTRYQLSCEAARLYIGVKRYWIIEPSILRCAAFLAVYFGNLTVFLAKRRALSQLGPIVRLSKVWRVGAAG
ncbi:glycosyltransferase family A protein [Paraburkholderia sp. JHI2823]|uniref:glycosyltransferase family 2 protein n=1 Tax=Paraburkholderia sp. JHI2823 TaxID=3112960 RepID=UPI0031784595